MVLDNLVLAFNKAYMAMQGSSVGGSAGIWVDLGVKIGVCDEDGKLLEKLRHAEKNAAYGDYDVDPDSADGLAESFVNGNISDVRKKLKGKRQKALKVLRILEEVAPDYVDSYRKAIFGEVF